MAHVVDQLLKIRHGAGIHLADDRDGESLVFRTEFFLQHPRGGGVFFGDDEEEEPAQES